MDNHKEEEAIAELSRAIAFKADLHLLHLRAAFHEHKGDVLGALRDCRAALSVDPNHQEMLELHTRVNSHEPWVKTSGITLAGIEKQKTQPLPHYEGWRGIAFMHPSVVMEIKFVNEKYS